MRLFALFLVAACSPLPPDAAVPEGSAPKKAYEILLEAKRFEGAHIGPSGTPSTNVIALGVLVKSPEGRAAFHALMARATTAGKLYALSGLYFVEPNAFEVEARRLAESKEDVDTQDGCLAGPRPIASIIFSGAKDRIELRKGMSLNEAFEGNEGRGTCDFGGGCTPLMLLQDHGPHRGTRPPIRP